MVTPQDETPSPAPHTAEAAAHLPVFSRFTSELAPARLAPTTPARPASTAVGVGFAQSELEGLCPVLVEELAGPGSTILRMDGRPAPQPGLPRAVRETSAFFTLLYTLLLARGPLGQWQVFTHARLWSLICAGCQQDDDPVVKAGACRALGATVARNKDIAEQVSQSSMRDVLCSSVLATVPRLQKQAQIAQECSCAQPGLDTAAPAASPAAAGLSASVCGALWALCALCIGNPLFQAWLASQLPFLLVLFQLLTTSTHDETVNSSTWLLNNIMLNNAETRDAVVAAGGVAPVLFVLRRGPLASRPLAAWCVRALVFGSPPLQQHLHALGVVAHLLPLLVVGQEAAAHTSALWALSSLVHAAPQLQREVAAADDGAVAKATIALLYSEVSEVRCHAAGLVYCLAARCVESQVVLGNCGAVEGCARMLTRTASEKEREKAVTALVALVLGSPSHAARLAAVPGFVPAAIALIAAPARGGPRSRVPGLAAGLLCLFAVECPRAHSLLVAHGALVALLQCCEDASEADAFTREQALGGYAALVFPGFACVSLAAATEPVPLLLALLERGTGMTPVAVGSVVCALLALCSGEEGKEAAAHLRARPLALAAIARHRDSVNLMREQAGQPATGPAATSSPVDDCVNTHVQVSSTGRNCSSRRNLDTSAAHAAQLLGLLLGPHAAQAATPQPEAAQAASKGAQGGLDADSDM